MPLRIAILGINGRLGQAIGREACIDDRFSLTGGIVRADSEESGQDIGEILGGPELGYQACVSLEEGTRDCDILIDASTPDACIAAAERLSGRDNFCFVTGVTGLDEDQRTRLKAASKTLPVMAARNFSVGIAVLESLAARAAGVLPSTLWDAEIEETHHRRKVDAPSGTALILGEAVAGARKQSLDRVRKDDRRGRRLTGDIAFSPNSRKLRWSTRPMTAASSHRGPWRPQPGCMGVRPVFTA